MFLDVYGLKFKLDFINNDDTIEKLKLVFCSSGIKTKNKSWAHTLYKLQLRRKAKPKYVCIAAGHSRHPSKKREKKIWTTAKPTH